MDEIASRFQFFTGKGGVGKTSLACATALKFADEGKRVLLISTDPASNLEDVLQSPVTNSITAHKTQPNLFTININPEIAAQEYRDRAIGPLKGIATEQEIAKVNEQLSGACTTEIASFDEFSRFITGEGNPEEYDVIIFDTAPTGHTIRLLELPAAWNEFLAENAKGASCIGPSSALKSSKERYKKVLESLRDPGMSMFYLVTRTDKSSLKEAARTSHELQELGLTNQKLLINGVFKAFDRRDAVAVKMEELAQRGLADMPEALRKLTRTDYPLLPYNILGPQKLKSLFDERAQRAIVESEISIPLEKGHPLPELSELIDQLEASGDSGLIMTMGKGGVGKTIVAATIAVMLAKRGHKVLLTTTDPAAHITYFVEQLDQLPENLTVERIDPKIETRRYTDKIIEQKGAALSAEEKELLIEDLRSPCTEEVAVFNAFSSAIYKAKRQFVVMDTAPTGHTLLLLDTTGAYHKEILKKSSGVSSKIKTPYMFLQDPSFAKILLVALPETTPMREAESLQNDLQRAGIIPYAWVVNQCLSALTNLTDPLLSKRAWAEGAIINNIETKLSKRTYRIPFISEEKLLPALLQRYSANKDVAFTSR